MVMGLQQLFQLIPLNGTPVKRQLMADETIQPLTFGEILKFKEGQLQQEQQVSASSIAAALAALQAQFIVLPLVIPVIGTGDVKTDASVDPSLQPAGTSAETSASSLATQPEATRFISTEGTASVPQAFANTQAGTGLQQTSLVNTSISATTDSTHVDFTNDAVNITVNRVGPGGITGYVATQAKKPTSSTGFKTPSDLTPRTKQEVAQKAQGPAARSAPQLQVNDAAMEHDTVPPLTVGQNISNISSITTPVNETHALSEVVPTPVLNSVDMSIPVQSVTVSPVPAEKISTVASRQLENPVAVDGKQFSSFEQFRKDGSKVVTKLDQPEIEGNGPAVRIGRDEIRTSPETSRQQVTARTTTKIESEAEAPVSETVSSSLNMELSNEITRSSIYAPTQAKTLPEQLKINPLPTDHEENPVIDTTVTDSKPEKTAQSTLPKDFPSGAKPEIGPDVPAFEVKTSVPKTDAAAFAVPTPQPKAETVQARDSLESFTQMSIAQNDIPASVPQLVTDEPKANVAWVSQDLPTPETLKPVSQEDVIVKNEKHVEVKNTTTNTPTVMRFETKDVMQDTVEDKLAFESSFIKNLTPVKPAADRGAGSEPLPGAPVLSSQTLSRAPEIKNIDQEAPDSKFMAEPKVTQAAQQGLVMQGNLDVVEDKSTLSEAEIPSTSENDSLIQRLATSRMAQPETVSGDQPVPVSKKEITDVKLVYKTPAAEGSPFVSASALDSKVETSTATIVRPEKLASAMEETVAVSSQITVKHTSETAVSDVNNVEKPIAPEKGTVASISNPGMAVEPSVITQDVSPEIGQRHATPLAPPTNSGTTQTMVLETNKSAKTTLQGGNDGKGTVTTFERVSTQTTTEQIKVENMSPKSSNIPVVTDELISTETKTTTIAQADTSFEEKSASMPQPLDVEAKAPEKPIESFTAQEAQASQSSSEKSVVKGSKFAYSHEAENVEVKIHVETPQSVTDIDATELQDGEPFVEIVGPGYQAKQVTADEPSNVVEQVVVESKEQLSRGYLETVQVSRPVAGDGSVSPKTSVHPGVADSAGMVGPKVQEKAIRVERSVDMSEPLADANIQTEDDSFEAKVADPEFVSVQQNENANKNKTEVVGSSPHVAGDASVSSKRVVRSDVLGAQPAATSIGTLGQKSSKESVRLNQPINPSEPISQVNKPSHDGVVEVKVSDREFVSAALKEKSTTSQAKVMESSQPVVSGAAIPVKTTSTSHAAESQFRETVTAVMEPKDQATSLSADKPVNTPQQFVVDSSENKNDAVNVKVVKQNEKLNTSHISASGEYEPVVHGSSAEPVEPKAEIKARLPIEWNEETQPADKRPELKQMPGVGVAAKGPGNEAQVAEVNGKMPEDQFHAQAVDVARQVIHEMKVNIKSGLTSMHMQLNPQDLGAIDVDMVSGPRGVQVTFFAEQASTGRLLETQLNQLRDSLVDSGVQLSGLNIGQYNQHGQKGGAFSQDTKFAPFTQPSFAEHKESIKDAPIMNRSIGQASEVDYRI